ncbi:MAG: phosphatidate cytidylyltransferase [Deltaproteobacteria bacterium]|nr:phosphatidate cytidylyltransferase [Deltaproteobacteria bacterium]MBI3296120.1 phosphatidate cytidylyltransferase [Deltaproteobacteria bacterium]
MRRLKLQVLDQHRHFPHLERKLYHMCNGLICFGLYNFFLTEAQALLVLGVVGGAGILFDLARLKIPTVHRFALAHFGGLMRREELRSLTGNSYFILGLFVVVALFPRPIVSLSVLYLALGDPIAALVGTRWGKTKISGKKSVEGAIANFAVAFLATVLFAAATQLPHPWVLAIVGATCSVIAELAPLGIDDNLTIPVISGALLWCVAQFAPLI